jgi:NADH-quinone oxidoreductase subunit G
MASITIDGKKIEFEPGRTIIQAARENGIEIPHFCWHPKLSVSGNCRVCLVEIENMPKLVIACATPASDGMVVFTNSEKAVKARNAVMEFILINHPLDCPICDEAGECKLQDYTYKYSVGESRFKEEKQHKDKRVPLGPNVMFDGDRCISCSRCIRFCDEIVKKPQLTFVKRGDRVTIVTYPGKELDNDYSLNVTDICPVGALTNRDFRFKSRVWELSVTKSVCNGCARGCNSEIWTRNNLILRITPRENESVNSYWMCDYGRLNTFKHINRFETRIEGAFVKKDGSHSPLEWGAAYKEAAAELKKFKKDEIAFIGSAYASNEDNYLFSKFAAELGVKNIDFMRHNDSSFGDDLLKRNDVTPNSAGAELAGITPLKTENSFSEIIRQINNGTIKALYLLEDDIVAADSSLADALSSLQLLIVHSVNFNKTTELAHFIFGASAYAEKNGTMINFEGRIQRLRPAVALKTPEMSLDGFVPSRPEKFGTEYDKWAKKNIKDVLPSWYIIKSIAKEMGIKMNYLTSEDIFIEMSRKIENLAGLTYTAIGDMGINIKEAAGKTAAKAL